MKTIKRVVLKTATKLSQEEMKYVFGGSGSGNEKSNCTSDCGTQPSISITNCIGTCTATDGSSVQCSGDTTVLTKNCDGTSSVLTDLSKY